MAPAMPVKVVFVAPADTMSVEACTGGIGGIGLLVGAVNAICSSGLLLLMPTPVPPEGAALLRVTVQVVAAALFNDAGAQERLLNVTGAVRLMVAVLETPLRVAVRVAL